MRDNAPRANDRFSPDRDALQDERPEADPSALPDADRLRLDRWTRASRPDGGPVCRALFGADGVGVVVEDLDTVT